MLRTDDWLSPLAYPKWIPRWMDESRQLHSSSSHSGKYSQFCLEIRCMGFRIQCVTDTCCAVLTQFTVPVEEIFQLNGRPADIELYR